MLGLRGRLRALARGDPLENPSWPAPLLPPEDATTEPPEGTVADDDPAKMLTRKSTTKTMLINQFISMRTLPNLVPYLQKKLEIFINREKSMTSGSTMAKSSLKIKMVWLK